MDDLELTFRRATDADLLLVTGWVEALYAEHPGPVPVDLSKVTASMRYFDKHPDRGGLYLLLEQGSEVALGYVIVTSYWSNEYGGIALILDELYVAAEHRNRRVGRLAIGKLPTLLPGQHVRVLLLEVEPDNPRARKLYESLGFQDTGRHPLRRLS